MKNYYTQPKTKAESNKRAKEIKKFLDEKTGGDWQIRVFQNIGWHISLTYGTITVSSRYHTASGVSYHIMNGGDGNNYGHIELKSISANNDNLIKMIEQSLKNQKEFVKKYIDGYKLNNALIQFKKL